MKPELEALRASPPDVLVVGSGGAGVAAAIEAAEAGATVAVVEVADELGGATIISGGGCFLVGTALQREKGIEDSVDAALEDWLAWGEGTADEEWARLYITESNQGLYEWALARGVTWEDVTPQEGNRARRWTRPAGLGRGLWLALHQHSRKVGVSDWLTGVSLVDVLVDGNRCIGARLRDTGTGEDVDVHCASVVVATGGYMSNREMIEQYRPDLIEARLLEGSAATAKGDGHLILASHGAQLVQMGAVWIYIYATADHHDPDGRRGLAVRGARDQIWVNAQGRRFHNEDLSGGGSGTAAVMGQSPPVAWTIFDRAMADTLSIADPYYRPGGVTSRERHEEFLNENPNVRQAASIEELAALIQVPAETLVATVNEWNAQIARGDERDAQTGRPLRGRLGLVKPPFYAMRMMPLARKSLGGVKTDLACRVVRADGSIIEGLFAAGEVAGMAGGHINGTKALEGTLLGPAIFSGRVAGAWAAAMSGHGDGYHPSEPAMVPVSRKHEAHA